MPAPKTRRSEATLLRNIAREMKTRIEQAHERRQREGFPDAERFLKREFRKFMLHSRGKIERLERFREFVSSGRWLADFDYFKVLNNNIWWHGHQGLIRAEAVERLDPKKHTLKIAEVQNSLTREINRAIHSVEDDRARVKSEEYQKQFREMLVEASTDRKKLTDAAHAIFKFDFGKRGKERNREKREIQERHELAAMKSRILMLSFIDIDLFQQLYRQLSLLPLSVYSDAEAKLERECGIKINEKFVVSRWFDGTEHGSFQLERKRPYFSTTGHKPSPEALNKAKRILQRAERKLTVHYELMHAFHSAIRYRGGEKTLLKQIEPFCRENIRTVSKRLIKTSADKGKKKIIS